MLSAYLVDFLAYSKCTTHFSIIIIFINTHYKGWNLRFVSIFSKSVLIQIYHYNVTFSCILSGRERGRAIAKKCWVLRMPTECQAWEDASWWFYLNWVIFSRHSNSITSVTFKKKNKNKKTKQKACYSWKMDFLKCITKVHLHVHSSPTGLHHVT